MPNASQRQGPLDHLGLADRATTDAEGGARLGARSFTSIIEIRAEWSDAFAGDVERLIGVKPPQTSPNVGVGDKCTAFWMGPNRWWFLSGDDELPSVHELRQHLAAFGAAATEIGDSFAALTLSGYHARDVFAKGCTIDMHPSVFQPACVVQTNLAKAQVAIFHPSGNEFEIYVRRSFTEYLWTWLEDASLEFGVRIETT
ncbi:MAG: sarcosine oxidase subunit gamma family protein [Pseudomonadota bacterium]|nr:sarcosine oxidase subunit gamma family protein [Pseudomonadota bacterium]